MNKQSMARTIRTAGKHHRPFVSLCYGPRADVHGSGYASSLWFYPWMKIEMREKKNRDKTAGNARNYAEKETSWILTRDQKRYSHLWPWLLLPPTAAMAVAPHDVETSHRFNLFFFSWKFFSVKSNGSANYLSRLLTSPTIIIRRR